MSVKKDQYTLIEQSILCSSYGPIDLLVIAIVHVHRSIAP